MSSKSFKVFLSWNESISIDNEVMGLIDKHITKAKIPLSTYLFNEYRLFVNSRSGYNFDDYRKLLTYDIKNDINKIIREKCGVSNLSKEFCDNVKRRIEANE